MIISLENQSQISVTLDQGYNILVSTNEWVTGIEQNRFVTERLVPRKQHFNTSLESEKCGTKCNYTPLKHSLGGQKESPCPSVYMVSGP